jgi:hypothetical protein
VPTPEEQALVKALEQLKAAKTQFDIADQALTAACKAYGVAKGEVETFVPDYAARCSR